MANSEAEDATSCHWTPADSRWSLWLQERNTQISELMILHRNKKNFPQDDWTVRCWQPMQGKCLEMDRGMLQGRERRRTERLWEEGEGGAPSHRGPKHPLQAYKSCQITSELLPALSPPCTLLSQHILAATIKNLYKFDHTCTETLKSVFIGWFPWTLQALWALFHSISLEKSRRLTVTLLSHKSL